MSTDSVPARSLSEARSQLEQAVAVLRETGALVRSAHANLSLRLDAGRVAMTRRSSVAELEARHPQALCVVELDGRVLEGEVDPAMGEVIAMHTRLYQERPDVGAVIHTHAPHLTAFAIAQRPLELVHEPMLREGLTRPVPVVPWAPRGSRESVEGIVARAKEDPGVKAVLLANHGALAFGADPVATARLLGTLEEAAGLAILAACLGGARSLPEDASRRVTARRAQFAEAQGGATA